MASAARGRGVGRALVEDALSWARALYRSLGFSIVGTAPEAFDHPEHGLVGLHVMHLKLR